MGYAKDTTIVSFVDFAAFSNLVMVALIYSGRRPASRVNNAIRGHLSL